MFLIQKFDVCESFIIGETESEGLAKDYCDKFNKLDKQYKYGYFEPDLITSIPNNAGMRNRYEIIINNGVIEHIDMEPVLSQVEAKSYIDKRWSHFIDNEGIFIVWAIDVDDAVRLVNETEEMCIHKDSSQEGEV